jgi:S-adenosylmethionine-diacylglycerol 3-amino-3-carboxypropyl transferase
MHVTSTIRQSKKRLDRAVHRSKLISMEGVLERLFTFAFKGLVYPQIWEDPEVDMQALQLKPDSKMVTIASGGCNVMSYLTANPQEITAVDLNRAHVALNRLKLTALEEFPDYETFYRFFGEADEKANIAAYEKYLKPAIDPETMAYWEGRDMTAWGRKRITLFSRDLYHHGMLGYFIGFGHFIAKIYGVDLSKMAEARDLNEQRSYFDKVLAPLFDKRLIRWATSKKMSLYGLGIPPAQYESLAAEGGGNMAGVLKQRLEKLACDFPMEDNYFAWQAFTRGYAFSQTHSGTGLSGPLPPYLKPQHFPEIRKRASHVRVVNRSFTEHLDNQDANSLDAYVLLDAQDWMTDRQLNDLWAGISRTARQGARVIFRTAGELSILPGRVNNEILGQWTYEAAESARLNKLDRSSIYGGFHLYIYN